MNTLVKKTSFSVLPENWKELLKAKNKSSVVNEALSFYFNYQEKIKKTENIYWENIEKSLLN